MFSSNISSLNSIEKIDYQKFIETGIPVVVFLVLVAMVGIVGNMHVLIVYGKSKEMRKRAVRIFILWLSATDLAACVLCMPFEMFDIRYDYTFSSPAACKFFRFCGHATSFISGGFLATIALERGLLTRKSNVRYTKKTDRFYNAISCSLVVFMLTLSIPTLFVIGVGKKEIPNETNLTGNNCGVLEEYKTVPVYTAYGVIVILTSSICFTPEFYIQFAPR